MPSVHPERSSTVAEPIALPVAGCIFLGVPNLGAPLADTASGYLRFLRLLFNINRTNVTELQAESHHLMGISSRFREVQKQCQFPVLSIFETEKWGHGVGLVGTGWLAKAKHSRLFFDSCLFDP